MSTKNSIMPFSIGSFDCVAVSDGGFSYNTANFFPAAPSEFLAQEFGGSVPGQIYSSYNCLAVKADGHWVLLDTGAAGLASTAGNLRANLESAGIKAGDVAKIVLTHAHPDHIGGLIGTDGQPSFPDAQLLMTRQEWDFWSRPDLFSRLPHHLPEMIRERQTRFFLSRVATLQRKVTLIEQETEIDRGIVMIPAPGHTPGHAIVEIRSGNDTLINISDTVLHPIHLAHPDWHPLYDMNQNEAEKTRRNILNQVASEGALVFAFHFPFPAIGHIKNKGNVWSWEPLIN